MHPDLHRYLDGELSRDALAPELRAEADEWDALLGVVALEGAGTAAPASLEARVMGALPERPAPGPLRRWWHWLAEPQSIRVRPIAVVATAAAVALALLLRPARPVPEPADRVALPSPEPAPAPVPTPASDVAVFVQFVFAGTGAHSVALAGDFNGWDPARNVLRDPDGDGMWTGLFALPPGLHKYMFVVDGERWVTDPRAERYVDDGFGMRNALIEVTAPRGRSS